MFGSAYSYVSCCFVGFVHLVDGPVARILPCLVTQVYVFTLGDGLQDTAASFIYLFPIFFVVFQPERFIEVDSDIFAVFDDGDIIWNEFVATEPGLFGCDA